MAFATANVRNDVFGSLRVTYGTWSASVGDAAGTINVEGGRVWLANFTSQDSSGNQTMRPLQVSTSTSGNVTTVTAYNLGGVTSGRFIIIHS